MKTCPFCSKEFKTRNHEYKCSLNPNRYVKIWTEEMIKHASMKSKKSNDEYWTQERRLEQSVRMLKIVKENPDSYSKSNVSGRVKMYEIESSKGVTKVKGTWERSVATLLNSFGINWTNSIKPFSYFWNNGWHLYFPDFYLFDLDIYIEVKGFETDRDIAKWKYFESPLIKIKKTEMKNLESFLKESIAAFSGGLQAHNL